MSLLSPPRSFGIVVNLGKTEVYLVHGTGGWEIQEQVPASAWKLESTQLLQIMVVGTHSKTDRHASLSQILFYAHTRARMHAHTYTVLTSALRSQLIYLLVSLPSDTIRT